MNFSAPFIHRPIATTLVTLGVALAGVISFFLLPVAPLPQVDFPVISVQASLPGASPDTMAATVATPLERALGAIAGVNELTTGTCAAAIPRPASQPSHTHIPRRNARSGDAGDSKIFVTSVQIMGCRVRMKSGRT